MARSDKERERKRAGLAYPARYARLGRVRFNTPGQWAMLAVAAVIILGLIIVALVAR